MKHEMPVETYTEKTLNLPTCKNIPHGFLLRREIGSGSKHYTLTTPRKGDLRQHGRLKFRGDGCASFKPYY